MIITSCPFSAAAKYHNTFHRHLKSPVGHKFSLALIINNKTEGIITVGRPSSRILDNGSCLEVTRLTTRGYRNACSMLYAAAKKYAKTNFNTSKLITYTRIDENGSSLKASGFKKAAKCRGRQWHGRQKNEIIDKVRWELNT